MKKILSVSLSVLLAFSLATGFVSCNKKTEGNEKPSSAPKLGITVQSLANAYWAGVFGEVEKLLKEKGWEYTLVDCKDNSQTQISQIENFINSGCNLIMVHPSDPNAIENVCGEARKAGVKVMSWDDKMTNTDVNWVLDNTELGYEIGKAASNFIKEHYSEANKAEVAIIDYPQTPVLLERETGIRNALTELAAGFYEIVATTPAIDTATALSGMETILQAHPNCKVVCTTGSGPDIGANEALMVHYNGSCPEDCGIFSADATLQQLQAIVDPKQASHVSVGFEGSNKRTALACVDIYEKLLTGFSFENQNVFRPLTAIGAENAPTYIPEF